MAEEVIGGIRVLGNIGLCPRGDVARNGQRSAHHDDVGVGGKGGIGKHSLGDGRRRTCGNNDQVITVIAHGLQEEIRGRLRVLGLIGRGKRDLAHAILAVDEGGNLAGLETVRAGAGKDRDIGPIQQLQQRQGIAHRQRHRDVAISTRHTDELKIGVGQGISQGQGIINAGIKIEDGLHLLLL